MARSLEMPRASKFLMLASVCIVVAALYFAQEVLIPLALAVLLSFLLTPACARLERLRLGRVASVLIVVLLALSIVAGVGWVVKEQFIELAEHSQEYRARIVKKYENLRAGDSRGIGGAIRKVEVAAAEGLGAAGAAATRPATAPSAAGQPLAGAVGIPVPAPAPALATAPRAAVPTPDDPLPVRDYPKPPSAVEQLTAYVGPAMGPLARTFLVIVFVVFMLLNREDLRDRVIRLVGFGRMNLTTQALDDAGHRISRYLLAQSLVNTTYGLCAAGGLWVVGRVFGHGTPFPNVLLWGLLCGVFRFVPYLGPWIGAAGPLLVAFGLYEHNAVLFGTMALLGTLELATSQAVEPLFYGSSTGISTLAVLVAAAFWTWLWGTPGLLLSTPLTVVLVVIGKYVPHLEFLGVLLGDEPVLEPPVRVYQRLLAHDQDEAGDVAREHFEKTDLLAVYDDVLLPALALAGHDARRGRLDREHQDYIHEAVRAIVEELGETDRAATKAAAAKAAANAEAAATSSKPIDVASVPPPPGPGVPAITGGAARTDTPAGAMLSASAPPLPKGCQVNVICLPAHDAADELGALMLAQLLEKRRYCAFPVSHDALASERVDAVAAHGAHSVVVSATPPDATAHARYLCRRLHERYADVSMVIGLWDPRVDLKRARDRIACDPAVRVAATLREVLEAVTQVVQPVIVGAAGPIGEGSNSDVKTQG